jgi:hypothetical protein
MTSPACDVVSFNWSPGWRRALGWLLAHAGIAVALVALGVGLGIVGECLWDVGDWAVVPAVVVMVPSLLLMLAGVLLFFFHCPPPILNLLSTTSIVSVHPDSLWVYESPLLDLFQKTVIVPFSSIVSVTRQPPVGGRGCIRIVHGADQKTEAIDEIGQADVDKLMAILAERCPAALPLDPPEPAGGMC